jgi:hypothetical protein
MTSNYEFREQIRGKHMKNFRLAVAIFAALAFVCPYLSAQDKPKTDSKAPVSTLKLQVTIVEREGEKKVTNLPYTLFLRAGDAPGAWTKLRTGSRVPVYVGKEGGTQYIDVGTSIDARGIAAEDGRFDITLNLERSWVDGEVDISTQRQGEASAEPNSGRFKQPIIRQFKTELTVPMHDGQTADTTEAADPGSGRVLTLIVTMNVVK